MNCSERENAIRCVYGEILTVKDIAEILKYPSANAVLKALSRKSLKLNVFKFQGKRGWHVTAHEIANYIDRSENNYD